MRLAKPKRKSDGFSFSRTLRKLGFASYANYLASDHWTQLRARILLNQPECLSCGNPARVIHHLTYRQLGNERDSDLMPLCHSCHGLVHNALDEKYPTRLVNFKAEHTKEVLFFATGCNQFNKSSRVRKSKTGRKIKPKKKNKCNRDNNLREHREKEKSRLHDSRAPRPWLPKIKVTCLEKELRRKYIPTEPFREDGFADRVRRRIAERQSVKPQEQRPEDIPALN